ncbi:PP2C family protein-serine/threonine phosphatase [Micromonospora chalcea]|uniref:Serine/threonine-protein phosphatase n=2 Tax=Micromonospora TaxID=1873 RepID=A0A420EQI5_9ACTN|nr:MULTISPECIES: PP2C family protein-serine/threonine phosphatase [Micromonospora]MBC8989598.1 serine/threonine-protein phosphatase [Micromonospora chalcea]RKF22931.1 serine/threonine-protein phosphatase [Micromonospora globbae]
MDDVFGQAGALREAYGRVDWAATPMGPVESWSPTLRTTVELTLQTRFAVTTFWGPELIMVYNEAYVPLIGDKHPAALGAPAAAVFPEIWDTIGPMLTGVLAGGPATWSQDLELFLDRRGFAEQCYFTFSYSAVRGSDGRVEGVIDIAAETTEQVVLQRRLTLLTRLTDALSMSDDPQRILLAAVGVLRAAPRDLPQADVLWPGVSAAGARLPAVPPSVFGRQDLVVEDWSGRTVAWLRLPTASPWRQQPVLVAELSPHLPVDEAYTRFLRLVGAAIGQAFDRAQARQVERRFVELERQMSEALQRSVLTEPAQPERLQVAVRYRAAVEQTRIGGDWYDSFLLPDGGLALTIGDVTGHDQRAAAAMAQIRNLLRGVAVTLRKPPSAVLGELDTAMRTLAVTAFATAVLARLDHTGGPQTLRWSNAGHPPPVLIVPDGTAKLLRTRPEVMLGVSPDATRTDHAVTLAPGSTVVLYTDGLIDRRGELLDAGLADLTTALTGTQNLTAEQVCEHLLDRYAASSDDDIALLVLHVPDADATALPAAST